MKKSNQAIMVITRDRPKYLRVCLDSVRAAAEVDKWDKLVQIDGPQRTNWTNGLASEYPEWDFIEWPTSLGILWHRIRALEDSFSLSYERVLYLDDDHIIRRDTLVGIPSKTEKDAFISMTGPGNTSEKGYSPSGNLIEKADALDLIGYVKSLEWCGKTRPNTDQVMGKDWKWDDSIFFRYNIDRNRFSRTRDKFYVGSIGVNGVDEQDPGDEIERELFAGPPKTWLANAVRIFNPARHTGFNPPLFRYE